MRKKAGKSKTKQTKRKVMKDLPASEAKTRNVKGGMFGLGDIVGQVTKQVTTGISFNPPVKKP